MLAPVEWLQAGVRLYAAGIDRIVHLCAGQDKVVHVFAGLAIWLVAAWVSRRSLASPLPLLFVGLAEAGNEILDRLAYGSWRWPDTASDIAVTLFWPIALMLALSCHAPLRQAARARCSSVAKRTDV